MRNDVCSPYWGTLLRGRAGYGRNPLCTLKVSYIYPLDPTDPLGEGLGEHCSSSSRGLEFGSPFCILCTSVDSAL